MHLLKMLVNGGNATYSSSGFQADSPELTG